MQIIKPKLTEIKSSILRLKEAYDFLLKENERLRTENNQLREESKNSAFNAVSPTGLDTTHNNENIKAEIQKYIAMIHECAELLK